VAGASLVVEFGILGPVQAVRDGRVLGLGGPRRRALLALLLVAAGRVVPAERLAEELWGDSPPPGAAGTLRAHVSRLRTLLSPDASLLTQGGGYALAAGPGQLDAAQFERLSAAGREALERGEAAVAAGRFREALGLWRGRALADVAEVEPLAREAARLEELRLVANEGRIEADLALGLAAELTGELKALVAEHPVRERLWRLLVLALYRDGRQADALATYRRAREMLAEELGIEPGEELRQLEQAVLRQEVPAAAPHRARHNLPVRLTSFVGREEDLATVAGLLGRARLVTLTGAGGAGKTRLALECAAGVVDRFPDGVWLAGLAGIADPGLVPSLVMEALGVRQSGEAAVMDALRWRLRSAELLLVLDNCEHLLGACADLVTRLLGGCPGLRVLATSREPLGVPGEAAYPVPPLAVPPESVDQQGLARAAAVRLFLTRGASARPGAGAAAPVAVVARICRELDGLPLAIELAAARMSVLSAEEIEAHLADKFRFLAYRQPVADPRHQTLKAAIGWSYELLSEEERGAFRGLSVFAGGFTLAAAAAVCCGGDEAAALDLVDQLIAKSLVVAEPAAAGTRYRLLETIRQYAAGCLAETGEAGPARLRHAETFLRLAEEERELAALAREQDNFRAALDFTLSAGSPAGPRLAGALGGFWLARGLFQEARGWLERALAAGPADPRLQADLHRLLGAVLHAAGDLDQAQAALAQGVQVAAEAGLSSAQARIRVLQADIQVWQGGALADAFQACDAAAAVLESYGDLEGAAEAWVVVGKLRFGASGGEAVAAEEALQRAAACARQSGNHHAERESGVWLAANLQDLPIPADAAAGRAEQLLEAAAGDPWAEAAILTPLALLYGFAGRFADARAAIRRAQSILTGSGAKFDWAASAMLAGQIELMAGDPAAAERNLREGYEAFRAMGERGFRATIASLLAEAAYAQGRFDQALRLTDEAEALAGADDIDTQGRWRATRAKLLARDGQFPAAVRLAEEAVALVPAMIYARAEFLVAKAKVSQQAGDLGEAEESLRRALQFYQDRRALPLADRTRALLASLAKQRHTRAQQGTEAKIGVPQAGRSSPDGSSTRSAGWQGGPPFQ
jgi:predicted ATPase/DNA-binding SARP family transcriptional activator